MYFIICNGINEHSRRLASKAYLLANVETEAKSLITPFHKSQPTANIRGAGTAARG